MHGPEVLRSNVELKYPERLKNPAVLLKKETPQAVRTNLGGAVLNPNLINVIKVIAPLAEDFLYEGPSEPLLGDANRTHEISVAKLFLA